MYVKFDIENESLEWYKKRSLFAKWAMVNKLDTLAAAYLKLKNNENINSFSLKKCVFSS